MARVDRSQGGFVEPTNNKPPRKGDFLARKNSFFSGHQPLLPNFIEKFEPILNKSVKKFADSKFLKALENDKLFEGGTRE